MRAAGLAIAIALCACAQEPETAASIMAKVAANQERAEQMRSRFVYDQTLLMRMRRGNHKLAREERSEFAVVPGPTGYTKKRLSFAGKYERKGRFVAYSEPHFEYKDVDVDGDVISDLADDFTNNTSTRDGFDKNQFPLTSAEQAKYNFRLLGKETVRGREVYRLAFTPKPKTEDASWKGEVLVDVHEFQPVLITTRLAHGIPFWVKTVLGTDLKYLGFSVAYDRFADGVWFPTSYGGEFEVRVIFAYKRMISVSLANTKFRRTDVSSELTYAEEASKP